MPLRNKTILITGASRGLGRALAETLAARRAKIVLVARKANEIEQVAAAIRMQGGRAFGIAGDVGDKRMIHPIVGQATALAGPIDVLINNASTLGPTPLQLLVDSDCEDLEQVLEVNLLGPFRLTKAVLGSMLLRGSGVVVNISSDAGIEAYPTWGSYGVSKAALDQLTRIWASEHSDTAVRIFSVDPGEMDTAMHARAMPDQDPSELTRPELVAERIADMIERPASALNGARLVASQWRATP